MDKKTSIFGIILVVLGALLLLSRFQIHLFQFLFPAALIATGVWFIWKKQRKENSIPPPPDYTSAGPSGHPMPPPPPPPRPGFGQPGPSATINPGGNLNATSASGASVNMGPTGMHAQSSFQSGQSQSTGGTGQTHTGSGGYHHGGTPGSTAYPQFEAGKVKYSKFIGDMFIECQNINMQNVEVSMFVGDLQVTLSGGRLTPGLNRMIISGFLGDIMVFVPRGLPLFVHCSGFVGDLDLLGRRSSGFGNTLDAQTAEYDSADAKLYVAINNFVGDVRVYYV